MTTVNEIILKYATLSTEPDILEIEDIPNINLYMDQVTTFMDEALRSYKRNPEDKILTKTMINNYTKAKIFPPPEKKKYTKHHIMLLVIIYHLKTILSMHDIGILLKPILKNDSITESGALIEEVYRGVVKIQHTTYHSMKRSALGETDIVVIEREILNSFEDEQVKKILLVLLLTAYAYTEKRLAEMILDNDF